MRGFCSRPSPSSHAAQQILLPGLLQADAKSSEALPSSLRCHPPSSPAKSSTSHRQRLRNEFVLPPWWSRETGPLESRCEVRGVRGLFGSKRSSAVLKLWEGRGGRGERRGEGGGETGTRRSRNSVASSALSLLSSLAVKFPPKQSKHVKTESVSMVKIGETPNLESFLLYEGFLTLLSSPVCCPTLQFLLDQSSSLLLSQFCPSFLPTSSFLQPSTLYGKRRFFFLPSFPSTLPSPFDLLPQLVELVPPPLLLPPFQHPPSPSSSLGSLHLSQPSTPLPFYLGLAHLVLVDLIVVQSGKEKGSLSSSRNLLLGLLITLPPSIPPKRESISILLLRGRSPPEATFQSPKSQEMGGREGRGGERKFQRAQSHHLPRPFSFLLFDLSLSSSR